MAGQSKDPQLDATKKAVRRDIQSQIDAADFATGVRTPEGKVFNKASKTNTSNKSEKESKGKLDLDDYLKQVKRGFIDITPEKNDKPFGGQLGDVEITRISQGDGKY